MDKTDFRGMNIDRYSLESFLSLSILKSLNLV